MLYDNYRNTGILLSQYCNYMIFMSYLQIVGIFYVLFLYCNYTILYSLICKFAIYIGIFYLNCRNIFDFRNIGI
jgi:hypothetical protein